MELFVYRFLDLANSYATTKTTVRVLQPHLAFKPILRFHWTIRRLRLVVFSNFVQILQLCQTSLLSQSLIKR